MGQRQLRRIAGDRAVGDPLQGQASLFGVAINRAFLSSSAVMRIGASPSTAVPGCSIVKNGNQERDRWETSRPRPVRTSCRLPTRAPRRRQRTAPQVPCPTRDQGPLPTASPTGCAEHPRIRLPRSPRRSRMTGPARSSSERAPASYHADHETEDESRRLRCCSRIVLNMRLHLPTCFRSGLRSRTSDRSGRDVPDREPEIRSHRVIRSMP